MPMAVLEIENKIDANDLVDFAELLSLNYSVDAVNPDSLEFKKASLIFLEAQRNGFTKDEFREATMRMLRKQKFPTWTLADFFDFERPMLYTKNEVLKMNNGDFFGFKRVTYPGMNEKLEVWCKETDIKPPFKVVKIKPQIFTPS